MKKRDWQIYTALRVNLIVLVRDVCQKIDFMGLISSKKNEQS